MKHQIQVGNIGTVIDTDSEDEALAAFAEYYQQSTDTGGRAYGESVTWFVDGEGHFQFVGDRDCETDEQYAPLYEVISHGIDHSQYFQGCGVSYTPFDHVVTGCGPTMWDALDDALEGIAQSVESDTERKVLIACIEHEHAPLRKTLEENSVHDYLVRDGQIGPDDDVPEDCELYHYVSICF